MHDLQKLFEARRRWQLARARLSWEEKLRIAEELRDAAIAMRDSGRRPHDRLVPDGSGGRPPGE